MSSNKNDSNRRNRKRNRGQGKKRSSFVPSVFDSKECSICGESIKDMTSAISPGGSDNPAHFDCLIKQLSEREDLKENEKIVYMGSGNFAVVEESDYTKRNLNILRKISPEDRESREDWRKNMRQELQV